MTLFAAPPAPPGVYLHLGGVGALLDLLERDPGTVAAAIGREPVAHLVIADPPWTYDQKPGNSGHAGIHYGTLGYGDIQEHIRRAATASDPGARLAIWATWPFLGIALDMIRTPDGDGPWRYVTGGSWYKERPGNGIGFHWLGVTEPVLICRREGTLYTDTSVSLDNGCASKPEAHSAKPVAWMRQWIRRWVPPDGVVLDLYGGLGTVACAAVLERRGYIGAEIDPKRHAAALERIAYAGASR